MHKLRLLAALLALLGVLATSCASAGVDTETTAAEPGRSESPDRPAGEGETADSSETDPQNEPTGETEAAELDESESQDATATSFDGVRFEVDQAEELDRVALVGIADDVEADEIAVVAMFEGHEVGFPVYEDESGMHIYAPLNPEGPGTDGQIELQITDGSEVGPILPLALVGLPAAPGASARFVGRTTATFETELAALNVTVDELLAAPIAGIDDGLRELKVVQELLDNGTDSDLTSLLSASDSGLSEQEMALLDSLVAKMLLNPTGQSRMQRTALALATAQDLSLQPGQPLTSTSAGLDGSLSAVNAVLLQTGGGCTANDLEIKSGQELSDHLKTGLAARTRLSGEAAKLDRQAEAAFGWGSLTPVVGAVSAGMSLSIAIGTVREKMRAGRYPSSVDGLIATLPKTDINADFEEPGRWSEVRVNAWATGYDARLDILRILAQAVTLPVNGTKVIAKLGKGGGGLTLVGEAFEINGKLGTKAATELVARLLANLPNSGRNLCPHTWDVDVTGLPWTSGRTIDGKLKVDSELRTFTPEELGLSAFEIKLNQSLFQVPEVKETYEITTHKIQLTLTPGSFRVQNPGELVDIGITFARSDSKQARWDPGTGEFVLPEPETKGDITRSVITPDSPNDFPVIVTAEFNGETGLYALPNPPERPVGIAKITLAELLVNPPNATIRIDSQLQYTATDRQGAPFPVSWATSGGSISEDGLYTAPSDPGQYTVTATSLTNSGTSETVVVNVVDPECQLVGTWALRPAPFFDQITQVAGNGARWSYISGESTMTLEEDGTFRSERNNLTSALTFEGQQLTIEINSTESGTYIDDGATLAINETQSNAVVQMILPGIGRTASPVAAPNGLSGKGAYTCEGEVLFVTLDGITATFDYLGLVFE